MTPEIVVAPSAGTASANTRASAGTSGLERFQEPERPPRKHHDLPPLDGVPTERRRVRPIRRFRDWSRGYAQALLLADSLVAVLAVLVPLTWYTPATYFSDEKTLVLVLGAGLGWPLAVAVAHGYDRSTFGVGDDELRAVLHAAVLAIAGAAVPSAAVGKFGVVSLAVIAIPLAGVLSVVARFVARWHLHCQQRRGRSVRRLILVGSAGATSELNDVLRRESHHGMAVIGACVPEAEVASAHTAGLVVLGNLEDALTVVRASDADAIAVTGGTATRHHYLRELSWAIEGTGIELLVHPGLVEVAGPRMHIRPYVGLPLLQVQQPHFTGWRRLVKRATDLVLSTVGLVLAAPVLVVVAAAIKLESPGPVLFKQVRVGLDGSTFTMWKFRSMHRDAEERLAELRRRNPGIGLMFKLADDPRITVVGQFLRKFSLDELPQLVNVIVGSMSLVGPRPPLQSEVDVYEHHARRRLLVTPGLTGLWQVSGRSLLSWEETVRLDLRYVENWTLTLDLLIIWKTFFAVLTRKGAY